MSQNIYITRNDSKLCISLLNEIEEVNQIISNNTYDLMLADSTIYDIYKDRIDFSDSALISDDSLLNTEYKNKSLLIIGGDSIISNILLTIDLNKLKSVDIIPTSFTAITDVRIYEAINYLNSIIICPKLLSSLTEKDYFSSISSVLGLGICRSSNYYSYVLNNMYEILDKDIDVLNELCLKTLKVLKIAIEKEENNTLYFGHRYAVIFKKFFKDSYSYGECLSFGIIAQAFTSWKNGLISIEDFYEIRDMFVAFNLPISFELENTDSLIEQIENNISQEEYIALNGFGKAVINSDLNLNLKESIEFLNFTEND